MEKIVADKAFKGKSSVILTYFNSVAYYMNLYK